MNLNCFTKAFTVFTMGIVLCSCTAQKSDSSHYAGLIKELDAIMDSDPYFSGSITIGSEKEVFFQKAYGYANRSLNVSMKVHHRFDIASLNKSMVGMLIMIAVEEGKLSLDDTLTQLLSDVTYSGDFDKRITIHDMLTHTSGLPDYDAVGEELKADNFRAFKRMHVTKTEYVDFISNLPAIGSPG